MDSKMLWIVILALLMFVSAKPTHGPLGVQVKEKGKMRIGVYGLSLDILGVGKCTNTFIIWYPVTEVTGPHFIKREGYCPCHLSCEPSCPLKLDDNGMMEIDVNEAPKGCIVTIMNAYTPSEKDSKGDEDTSWLIYAAVLALIGVMLLFVVLGVVAWFCFRPRWRRARAARNAAAVQKTAVGAEVEEDAAAGPSLTSVPSNTAMSSGVPSTASAPKRARTSKAKTLRSRRRD